MQIFQNKDYNDYNFRLPAVVPGKRLKNKMYSKRRYFGMAKKCSKF